MTCMFVPAMPFPQVAPEHVEDNDIENAGAANTTSGAEPTSLDDEGEHSEGPEGKNSDGQTTTSEPTLEL